MDENEDAPSDRRRRAPGGRRIGRSDGDAGEGAMLIRLARVRPGYDGARRPPADDEDDDVEDSAPLPARRPESAPTVPGRTPLPQRADVARMVGNRATLDRLLTSSRRSMSPVLLSFLLLVMLPTVLAGAYYSFVASPQYASEFRFSVRSQDGTGALDTMSRRPASIPWPSSPTTSSSPTSPRAATWSTSWRPKSACAASHGAEHVDWWSRFDRSGSAEKLVRYWADKVDAHFDMTTGINVIAVRAFSPHDAHVIAQALQRMCEELVNGISERGPPHADAICRGPGRPGRGEAARHPRSGARVPHPREVRRRLQDRRRADRARLQDRGRPPPPSAPSTTWWPSIWSRIPPG